nr:uncharacterized protein LOC110366324 isoform X5 [Columba livia]
MAEIFYFSWWMDKSRISGAPRAEGVIPEEHSVTRREERSNMPSVQEQEGEGGTRGGDKDASFPVLGAASQESFTAPVSRSIRAFVFHPSFPWPDEIILEQGCGGERCRKMEARKMYCTPPWSGLQLSPTPTCDISSEEPAKGKTHPCGGPLPPLWQLVTTVTRSCWLQWQ